MFNFHPEIKIFYFLFKIQDFYRATGLNTPTKEQPFAAKIMPAAATKCVQFNSLKDVAYSCISCLGQKFHFNLEIKDFIKK